MRNTKTKARILEMPVFFFSSLIPLHIVRLIVRARGLTRYAMTHPISSGTK